MAGSVSRHSEVEKDYQQAGGVAKMILLDLGYQDEVDKISCRWVDSGPRDRSRAWAIIIAFSLARELRRARRCVAICNKVKKNFLTRWEKGEENQWIDRC